MPKIVAFIEAGTHPAAQGFLSGIAQVRGIRSAQEALQAAGQNPDIVLVDVTMPTVSPADVVRAVRAAKPSLILMLDMKQPPSKVRRVLGKVGALSRATPADVGITTIWQTLQVPQETLGRILNVSSKTAHRWVRRRTKPREKPELQQLAKLVSLLRQTIPDRAAIKAYLNHRNPALGGETPLALLTRGEFDKVAADLAAIREGVYL